MRQKLNFMVTTIKRYVWRTVNRAYDEKQTTPTMKLGVVSVVLRLSEIHLKTQDECRKLSENSWRKLACISINDPKPEQNRPFGVCSRRNWRFFKALWEGLGPEKKLDDHIQHKPFVLLYDGSCAMRSVSLRCPNIGLLCLCGILFVLWTCIPGFTLLKEYLYF